MMREALRNHSSFNLIHTGSMYKVDVYVPKNRAFDRSQMERSLKETVDIEGTLHTVVIASAEDTVLAKLEWYKMGNEVSDMQWRDVLYVLRNNEGRLDLDYMRAASVEIGVDALLKRALAEAAQ